MDITNEQKEQIKTLIREGKKIKAVRQLQQSYGLTAEQALILVEELNKQVEGLPKSHDVIRVQLLHKMRSSTKGANIGKYIGSFFAVCGLLMLAGATYSYVSDAEFISHAELTTGKCIAYDSYISSSDGSSTTMYTPIFHYEFRGQDYEQQGSISSSSRDYAIGEIVEIYVNPELPTEVVINSFWDRWFIVLILGVMGVMFSGMGLLAVVMSRKSNG